jgi:hypothetical protein
MTQRNRIPEENDLDGLRLFALGRIPRCRGCARYHSLVAAQEAASRPRTKPPAVPGFCSHQVCAPLVDHYFGRRRDSWVTRVAVCGL